MQGIGYKEVAAWIRGESDRETAIALWKRRTRNYAKRQETWFRREPDMHWIGVSGRDPAAVLEEALTLAVDARAGKEPVL